MNTKKEVDKLEESNIVLEKVLSIERVLAVISHFPELTNALNDSLDLVKRLTEESETPVLLGPKLWRLLMTSAYTRTGVTELQIEILNVLSYVLAVKGVADIVDTLPECREALSSNCQLAAAIVNDGSTAQIMENSLWRRLVQVMQGPLEPQVKKSSGTMETKDHHESDGTVTKALRDDVEQLKAQVHELTGLLDCSFKDSLSLDLALKVLPVASQLQMTGLVCKIVSVLCESLSINTCIRIFQTSSKADVPEIRKMAFQCLTTNFKMVSMQAQDFTSLSYDEFKEVASSDSVAANEEVVFEAVCKWIKSDLDVRRKHCKSLFQTVRFSCLDLGCLLRVKDHFLVADQVAILNELDTLIKLATSEPETLEKLSLPVRRTGLGNKCPTGWTQPEDVIFILGGREKADEQTLVETLTSKKNHWEVQFKFPDPPKGATASLSLGGIIFVLEWQEKRVRCFDPQTKKWKNLSPMPTYKEGICMACNENTVYVMGGKLETERMNTCHAYNIQTNSWSQINSMQFQRNYAAATHFKGQIYCSGGYDGFRNHFSTEVFDPTKNSWTSVSPMLQERQAHGLVSSSDYVWAVGGLNFHQIVHVLERYNPVTDAWTHVSSMPTPRSDLGVVIMKQFIYTIGGETSTGTLDPTDVTEVYDTVQNRWSVGPKIFKPRAYMGACVVHSLPTVHLYTKE